MQNTQSNRRNFIKSAAGIMLSSSIVQEISAKSSLIESPYIIKNIAPKIQFSVIGINHGHIYGMVDAVVRGGGQLISVYAKEADLLDAFVKKYPQVKTVREDRKSVV